VRTENRKPYKPLINKTRVMLNSAPGALVKHAQKGNKRIKLMLER
jgi:hypothetical protein